MTIRKPIVMIAGQLQNLPAEDSLSPSALTGAVSDNALITLTPSGDPSGEQDRLALIESLENNESTFLQSGTYYLDGYVDIPSNRIIKCLGSATIIPIFNLGLGPDNRENCVFAIRGVATDVVNTTLAATGWKGDSSITVSVSLSAGLAGSWLRLRGINTAGQSFLIDSNTSIVSEIVQISDDFAGGTTILLNSPLRIHHISTTSVVSIVPRTNVTVEGLFFDCSVNDYIGSTILIEDSENITINNVSGRNLSRAILSFYGSNNCATNYITNRGSSNCCLYRETTQDSIFRNTVRTNEGARAHSLGTPRPELSMRAHCVGLLDDGFKVENCNGVLRQWGGLSNLQINGTFSNVDGYNIAYRDPDISSGNRMFGTVFDGGPGPTDPGEDHAEFGFGCGISNIRGHNVYHTDAWYPGGLPAQFWLYLHDHYTFTLNGVAISNEGQSPVNGSICSGAMVSDFNGTISNLQLKGCDIGMAFQNVSDSIRISNVELVANSGESEATLYPCFHFNFSGSNRNQPHFDNIMINGWGGDWAHFGTDFTSTPTNWLSFSWVSVEGYEYTDVYAASSADWVNQVGPYHGQFGTLTGSSPSVALAAGPSAKSVIYASQPSNGWAMIAYGNGAVLTADSGITVGDVVIPHTNGNGIEGAVPTGPSDIWYQAISSYSNNYVLVERRTGVSDTPVFDRVDTVHVKSTTTLDLEGTSVRIYDESNLVLTADYDSSQSRLTAAGGLKIISGAALTLDQVSDVKFLTGSLVDGSGNGALTYSLPNSGAHVINHGNGNGACTPSSVTYTIPRRLTGGTTGSTFTIQAQQGQTGSLGGNVIIKSGLGGTPGTNKAGDVILEIGQGQGDGDTAKVSIQSNGTEVMHFRSYFGAYGIISTSYGAGLLINSTGLVAQTGSIVSFESTSGHIRFNSANSTIGFISANTYDGSVVGALNYVLNNSGTHTVSHGNGSNSVPTSVVYSISAYTTTGATVGTSFSIRAQDGRSQTGGANNNDGGVARLASGAAGTGGSGTAALPGKVHLGLGATDALTLEDVTGSSYQLSFADGSSYQLTVASKATGNAGALYITGQATGGGNGNGGDVVVRSGNKNGSGVPGKIQLAISVSSTVYMMEALEIASGRNILALCGGAAVTTTEMPANSGDKVIWLAPCDTAPTANPGGDGVILYGSRGVLYARDNSGFIHGLNARAQDTNASSKQQFSIVSHTTVASVSTTTIQTILGTDLPSGNFSCQILVRIIAYDTAEDTTFEGLRKLSIKNLSSTLTLGSATDGTVTVGTDVNGTTLAPSFSYDINSGNIRIRVTQAKTNSTRWTVHSDILVVVH